MFLLQENMIVIPKKGMLGFRSGTWPMENLSECDFFKKKFMLTILIILSISSEKLTFM